MFEVEISAQLGYDFKVKLRIILLATNAEPNRHTKVPLNAKEESIA